MNNNHFSILLSKFPLGVRIKFEHRVKKYQQSLNHPQIANSHIVPILCSTNNNKLIDASDNIFQLDIVLKSNIQGTFILDYFQKYNILNESCRNMLVEIIISFVIKKEIQMTLKLANSIANAIVGTFASEIKVNNIGIFSIK